MHIYLLVMEWNSAVRCTAHLREQQLRMPLATEALGVIIVILFFNTLRKVAVLMINPYGDDDIDYELDHDLRNLLRTAIDVARSFEMGQNTVLGLHGGGGGGGVSGERPQPVRQEESLTRPAEIELAA